jgi:hypothetical protein
MAFFLTLSNYLSIKELRQNIQQFIYEFFAHK